MALAFLILAHHLPAHFGRLVRALSDAGGSIFVHVDAKVDERPFRQAAADVLRTSFVERRRRVFHAGYSMVGATLELMRAALGGPRAVSKLVLLSGDSYPIRPGRVIRERLSGDAAIIGHIRVRPDSECDRHVLGLRYQDCSLLNERASARSPARALAAGAAQRLLGLLLRKGDSPLPLFRGSQWWALPRDMAEHCLEVSDSPAGAALVRYLRMTDASDELFFQTILLNSPHRERCLRLGPHERNAGPVYSDFASGREQPALLDLSDLPALRACPALFARKFHETRSRELREAIDRELRVEARAAGRATPRRLVEPSAV
jgi:hypothetical protein